MKKTIIILLACTCFITQSFTQAWEGKDASFPYSLWGESVYAINDSVAWTWGIELDPDGYPTLKKNTISKTNDKGLSWYNVVSPFDELSFVTSLCALNEDTAWVSFTTYNDINDLMPSANKVMTTTDGGFTWTQVNVEINAFVNFIYMWNPMEGIVVGDPDTAGFEIYQTLDGGENWTRIQKLADSQTDEYIYKDNYAVKGDQLWFATTTGRVFYTESRGSAWTVTDAPVSGYYCDVMNVNEEGDVFLVFNEYSPGTQSNEYLMFRKDKTTGKWIDLTQQNSDYIYDIWPVPNTDAILRTLFTNGYITQISYDHGETWMTVDSNNRATFMSFYDPFTGYAAQANWGSDPSKTLVYRYVGSPLSGLLKNVPLSNASLYATPNPTSGETSISLQDITPGQYWILVHDISGNLKYKVDLFAVDILEEKLDLGSLPAGVYTITVSSNQGVATTKITKQ